MEAESAPLTGSTATTTIRSSPFPTAAATAPPPPPASTGRAPPPSRRHPPRSAATAPRAGAAAAGSGVGPGYFDYVLGISKAYTTRVGSGPFPTELTDDVGSQLAERGREFGATTGRARRCGWLDVVALRQAVVLNGANGLCVTKLDVLDGLEKIQVCVGYRLDGDEWGRLPEGADALGKCEPVYRELPGWSESTAGVTELEQLPRNARDYLDQIERLCGAPIDIVSTGPERSQTIIRKNPFG